MYMICRRHVVVSVWFSCKITPWGSNTKTVLLVSTLTLFYVLSQSICSSSELPNDSESLSHLLSVLSSTGQSVSSVVSQLSLWVSLAALDCLRHSSGWTVLLPFGAHVRNKHLHCWDSECELSFFSLTLRFWNHIFTWNYMDLIISSTLLFITTSKAVFYNSSSMTEKTVSLIHFLTCFSERFK